MRSGAHASGAGNGQRIALARVWRVVGPGGVFEGRLVGRCRCGAEVNALGMAMQRHYLPMVVASPEYLTNGSGLR